MIKTKRISVHLFLFLSIGFSYSLFLSSCKSYHRNSTHKEVSISSIKKGEALAKIYCQSCHMLPDPSLLDTKSWEKGVLPEMGPRLGIVRYGFEIYPQRKDQNLPANFYPSQPVLSYTDWQNILDYYVATSPDSLLPAKRKDSIREGLPLFKVEFPHLNYTGSATSYVKINPDDTAHPIIISDVIKQNLYFINKNLTIADSVAGTGPIVDINYSKDFLLACDIGVLNPNNGKFGKGVIIRKNASGKMQKDSIPAHR